MQTVATVAVALFAALIAFGQFWTARQKLALDLFEKRLQVFMDIRRIASEAIQLGELTDPGLSNEIVARARFLFGDDINEAVREMHHLTIQLEVKDPGAGMQINELFRRMMPMFSRYMGMTQTLPTWRSGAPM